MLVYEVNDCTHRLWIFSFLFGLLSFHLNTSDSLSVLVYVDDLVVAGNGFKAVIDLKLYLGRCFHMKDLGVLKYFLGIEVSRGPEGLVPAQIRTGYCGGDKFVRGQTGVCPN